MMCNPMHPGREIRRRYEQLKTSANMAQFAGKLRVSRYRLGRVMNGLAPVEPDLAIRLARILRGRREWWLRMQADYDLWKAAMAEGLRKRKRARRYGDLGAPMVIVVMADRSAAERACRARVGRIPR